MNGVSAPAPWTEEELVVARMFERVLSNLAAQTKHDNAQDVVLTTMLIGVELGRNPEIGAHAARVMWRMIEVFGPVQEKVILGAVGGFLGEIRKQLRLKPWMEGLR